MINNHIDTKAIGISKITLKQFSTSNYYIFWAIMMLGKGLGFTGESKELQSLTFIAVIFWILKMLLTNWTLNELLYSMSILVLGIACYIDSGYTGILFSMMAIVGLKHVNIDKLFGIGLYIRAPLYFINLVLGILGYKDLEPILRVSNGAIRYGLGYGHPNAAHYNLFVITVFYLYYSRDRMNFMRAIIILMINLYVYSFTNSRTGVVMIFLLVALSLLIKLKIINKFLNILSKYTYIVLSIISILIAFFFLSFGSLGRFGTLSSRFNTANIMLQNNFVSLFGNPNINTDLGYVEILMQSGLIIFVFFILGNTILIYNFAKGGEYIKVIILFVYGIYTFFESYSISVLMNISLLYFSFFIFKRNLGCYKKEIT